MNKYEQNLRQKGQGAENIAVEFLENLGYEIIKRNFHFGRTGEIDIIAKDNDSLVFVEVKGRESFKYGDPLLSITPKKQNALRRTAEGYLYVNKISDVECRFDIITIDLREKPPKIVHLINAM